MVLVQPVYSDLVSVLGQGVVLVQPVYSDLVSVLGQGVVLVQPVYSDLVFVEAFKRMGWISPASKSHLFHPVST